MFLEDKLRDQLPRGLQNVRIIIGPSLGESVAVEIFSTNGRSVKLEVDIETGLLTDVQIAHLCVTL